MKWALMDCERAFFRIGEYEKEYRNLVAGNMQIHLYSLSFFRMRKSEVLIFFGF